MTKSKYFYQPVSYISAKVAKSHGQHIVDSFKKGATAMFTGVKFEPDPDASVIVVIHDSGIKDNTAPNGCMLLCETVFFKTNSEYSWKEMDSYSYHTHIQSDLRSTGSVKILDDYFSGKGAMQIKEMLDETTPGTVRYYYNYHNKFITL